jgi:hypothetical protein
MEYPEKKRGGGGFASCATIQFPIIFFPGGYFNQQTKKKIIP